MELLLLLLSAHFIADFYLQPMKELNFQANRNNTKLLTLKKNWRHFLLRTTLYLIVFLIVKLTLLSIVISVFIISLSHLLSVFWQFYRPNNLSYFLLDQSIQLLLITTVWACVTGFTWDQSMTFIMQFLSAKNMLIAISYLLVCKPASIVISLALQKHTDSLTNTYTKPLAHDNEEKNLVEDSKETILMTKNTYVEQHTKTTHINENESIGLLSAGAWIGYIERCLAISFIFMGQFAGIGFLVATKTIFRFGDLTKNKDMKLTEYMMLGTLLSYAIALFVGWNTLQIYKMI